MEPTTGITTARVR
jgi:hypothetical protein